jgi:hypothetical protein
MVVLDASRRNHRVPRLAAWSLSAGIVATVGANLAHGLGHGPIGAVVSAWPALALIASFELLMLLIRNQHQDSIDRSTDATPDHSVPAPEQMVRAKYHAGQSQRAIALELSIDRRKVRRIIDQAA